MAIKKISEGSLNKTLNKFNEKISKKVTDRFGEVYEVEVNKYLRKSDAQKILVDFLRVMEELKEVEYVESLKDIIIPMLMMKYFTNIPIPESGEELLMLSDKLIELELFSEIVNLFPEDELMKISELLEQFNKSADKIIERKQTVESNKGA